MERLRIAIASLLALALIAAEAPAAAAPKRVDVIPMAGDDGPGYIEAMGAPGGILHVADSKQGRVWVFGDEVTRFELESDGGLFGGPEPAGIAGAGSNRLAVVDRSAARVALLRPDGTRITTFGEEGSAAGELSYPAGVAVSANERVYVADRDNGRIAVFGPSGVFLHHMGSSELERPTALGVNAAEHVFVLDRTGDGRVYQFDARGGVIDQWSAEALAGDDELELSALALGPDNVLYVADKERGRVFVLDREQDRLVAGFGTRGSGEGQFDEISALAGLSGARVAVGDSGNAKIEVYRVGVEGEAAERAWLPWVDRAQDNVSPCRRGPRVGEDAFLCLLPDEGAVVLRNAAGEDRQRYTAPEMGDLRTAVADDRTVAVLHGEHLSLFQRSGERVTTIGGYGDGQSEFEEPVDVALGEDRVYVVDESLERIQVFSREGVFLRAIRDEAFGTNHIDDPVAVVADDQGTVYIADAGRSDVAVFNGDGEFLYRLPGRDGEAGVRFTEVRDLAMDDDGQLYVLGGIDGAEARITVFNGPRVVFGFGSDSGGAGALDSPKRITVGAWPGTSVHVEGEDGTTTLRYVQAPGRVTGVRIAGDRERVRLRWSPVAGSFVTQYRVYAAPIEGGDFLQIGESKAPEAAFDRRDQLARRYRVVAVSGFDREGPRSSSARDRFGMALRALEAGEAGRGERLLRDLYSERGDDPAVIEALGRALLAQGAAGEAAELFQRLVEVAADTGAAQRLRVTALLEAEAHGEAFAAAQTAIEAGAANDQTLLHCAEAALVLRDAIGAVECLDRLPDDAEAWADGAFHLARARVALGLPDEAMTAVERGVSAAGGTPRAHARAAAILRELERNDAALRHYRRAVDGGVDDAAVYLGYARTALALERYDRVNNIASRLVSTSTTEPEGRYLRGLVAYEQGEHSRALVELRRATRARDDFVEAWLALADTYAAMERPADRRDALQSAWAADARSFDAAVRYGRLLREREDFAASIEPLRVAHEQRPEGVDLALDLADSLLRAERLQRARDVAEQAIKRASETATRNDARVLLAEVNRRLGRTARATELVQTVMESRPDDAGLHIKLGRIYLDSNVYDRAEQALDKAQTLAPQNARVHRLLGDLYLAQRVFDDAISAYERAVDLEPNSRNRSALEAAFAEKERAREFEGDRPQVVLRKLQLEPVFAAAYKKYADEPFGSVIVENVGQRNYDDLTLTFRVKGYMDFATQHDIDELAAGDKKRIDLKAAFNNKMLDIDEDTGLQSEVALAYGAAGEADSIRLTQRLTVYGKNSILWGRDAMVGAFVTPRDDTVRDFVRRVVNEHRPEPGPLSEPVVTAMTLYDALSAHGMEYVVDPNSPFAEVEDDKIDYVQYPRESLRLKTGDCDDLSVLLSAALQNLGIETAMVQVPGHLFMMFNTGLAADKRDRVSADPDLTVVRDGEVWVPLEATLISESFADAWAEGAAKYTRHDRSGDLEVVTLERAWQQFEPVTLGPSNESVEIPQPSTVGPLVERDRELLLEKSIQRLTKPYRAMLATNPADRQARLQIAILQGRYGLYEEALAGFAEILAEHPGDSAALNNRANVFFKQGKIDKAIETYRQAETQAPNDAGIKVNLARAYYQRGDLGSAREKLAKAERIDPKVTERNERLVNLLSK